MKKKPDDAIRKEKNYTNWYLTKNSVKKKEKTKKKVVQFENNQPITYASSKEKKTPIEYLKQKRKSAKYTM